MTVGIGKIIEAISFHCGVVSNHLRLDECVSKTTNVFTLGFFYGYYPSTCQIKRKHHLVVPPTSYGFS